ncbi:MAG: hypothetical protein G8D89_17900 [gamma proteobacterium symbiont of Clathrolucina costata]
MHSAQYALRKITDNFVLIIDLDIGRTVTNDAESVVKMLNLELPGGLGKKKVYYRDTCGRFDELKHQNGNFTSISACSDAQQDFFAQLIQEGECL